MLDRDIVVIAEGAIRVINPNGKSPGGGRERRARVQKRPCQGPQDTFQSLLMGHYSILSKCKTVFQVVGIPTKAYIAWPTHSGARNDILELDEFALPKTYRKRQNAFGAAQD